MGRLLLDAETTNLLLPPEVLFFAKVEEEISESLEAALRINVLLEATPGSFSSSSADWCGERNRAVGRGPDDEAGPRLFLRIGCAGGGLEALDDRLRSSLSAANT